MKTAYLLDGFALIFRSYYALPPSMRSPVTGEVTNATYGVAVNLIKLFEGKRPDYCAMAVESRVPTFRETIYPAYKAHRDAPPEDLIAQIPAILELAKLFGLPILEIPGLEADDVLATLAVRLTAGDENLRVRLVTKDKDLDQVLSERVEIYDAHKDEVIGPAGLLEKKGIRPEQARDYQALIGDTSDNIPGVKGIGPKTAATLLQTYGTLDNLLARTGELKGAQKDKIEAAAKDGTLAISRKLVALDTAAGFAFDLEGCATGENAIGRIQADALFERFKQLGFQKLRPDLERLLGRASLATGTEGVSPPIKPASSSPAKKKPEPAAFGLFADLAEESKESEPAEEGKIPSLPVIPRTSEEVATLVAKLRAEKPLLAFDTETIGLGRTAPLVGICLAWGKSGEECADNSAYIPLRSPEADTHLSPEEGVALLKPLLEDPAIPKCAHNAKYDLQTLRAAGIETRGLVFDSMIGAFLSGSPGMGLKDLARGELGMEPSDIENLIGPRPKRKGDAPQRTMDQVPLASAARYGAEDADMTLRLTRILQARCEEMGMRGLADQVEMPLVQVLTDMEDAGIRVDKKILGDQRAELEAKVAQLRRQILDLCGDFNPDSPKQLADVLFNKLGFKGGKKTETGYSTDSEVLEKLAEGEGAAGVADEARQVPALMLEYRSLTKLVGTYLVALDEAIESDGRVHCRFHQTGAATGRLSSSDPNLQNIPIRTEVGKRIRGAFVAGPGNLLVVADYSQIELRLLAHLSGDPGLLDAFAKGQDIHAAVAAQVFGVAEAEVSKDLRAKAKAINFGIVYGVSAWGLARQVEGLGNQGAAELIANYKLKYAGITSFLDQCVMEAKDKGFVTTILGRRRIIDNISSRNPAERNQAERLAINSVVQGSAADLIKKAMVDLHARLKAECPQARLLLQIHDELVLEAPAALAPQVAQLVKATMEGAMALKTPLVADTGIGGNWLEAK